MVLLITFKQERDFMIRTKVKYFIYYTTYDINLVQFRLENPYEFWVAIFSLALSF